MFTDTASIDQYICNLVPLSLKCDEGRGSLIDRFNYSYVKVMKELHCNSKHVIALLQLTPIEVV